MARADQELPSDAGEQRLDRWLWFSRMLKSRTMAAQLVAEGKVRVNRARALKPSQTVRPGDVLTIAIRGRVQVVRVVATGYRRGPPGEARQLYEPIEPAKVGPTAARTPRGVESRAARGEKSG
jgi:ribosome-associated heat shock protein Hsp15